MRIYGHKGITYVLNYENILAMTKTHWSCKTDPVWPTIIRTYGQHFTRHFTKGASINDYGAKDMLFGNSKTIYIESIMAGFAFSAPVFWISHHSLRLHSQKTIDFNGNNRQRWKPEAIFIRVRIAFDRRVLRVAHHHWCTQCNLVCGIPVSSD